MTHPKWLPLFGLLGILLPGCKPELTGVELTPATTPPLDVVVSGQGLVIPEGIAVAVDVVGIDEDGDEQDDLSISPSYDSEAVGWATTATKDRFVIHGQQVGTGTIVFTAMSVDGTATVPVTVTDQL